MKGVSISSISELSSNFEKLFLMHMKSCFIRSHHHLIHFISNIEIITIMKLFKSLPDFRQPFNALISLFILFNYFIPQICDYSQ